MNLELEMASAPVFFSGKFHGQWSLAGYSSWVCKESDTTEHIHTYTTDNEWFAFLYTWHAERSQLLKNVHDLGGWHS